MCGSPPQSGDIVDLVGKSYRYLRVEQVFGPRSREKGPGSPGVPAEGTGSVEFLPLTGGKR